MPVIRKKSFAEMLENMPSENGEKQSEGGSIANLMKAIMNHQGKKQEDTQADENYQNQFENVNALEDGQQEDQSDEGYGAMSGDLDKLSRFAQGALAPKNKDMMDNEGFDLSSDEDNWGNYRKKIFKRSTL